MYTENYELTHLRFQNVVDENFIKLDDINGLITNNKIMIDNKLIEKALELTGKTMEDMNETIQREFVEEVWRFSIEKFVYYLLSEGFIDQYTQNTWWTTSELDYTFEDMAERFWKAIYQFQSWDAEPLISLLSKI